MLFTMMNFLKILFLSSVHTATSCDFPIALYNNQSYTFNGTEVLTGTVGVCADGTLVGYCDVGNIADGTARYFCNALGYLGKLVCNVIISFFNFFCLFNV